MSDASSLALCGLTKVFKTDVFKKKQVALDQVTMRFPPGLCTGLLGHNGAGKTTAIRLILGLIRPDAGKVEINGQPMTMTARRRLGYMPEVNKLPGALTPREILDNHLRLFGTTSDRALAVAAALAEVGLEGHAKKRIAHLSKGMARRVAWAQAVIHRPSLLILDEPSSGLDPLGRRDMLAWIEAEKRRGTTILLCTHEMSQVKLLCDELHILNKGRLVLTTLPVDGTSPHPPTVLSKGLRHVITVSGGDEARLRRLGEAEQLPPWGGLTRDGFLNVLSFAKSADAMRWLAALAAGGFVVMRFTDEAFAPEEELLPYFGGGV